MVCEPRASPRAGIVQTCKSPLLACTLWVAHTERFNKLAVCQNFSRMTYADDYALCIVDLAVHTPHMGFWAKVLYFNHSKTILDK